MKMKAQIDVPVEVPKEGMQLESKDPATVVKLLDSQEVHILIAACAAIFKHSEKCEENKVFLLSLNPLDKLLSLAQHPCVPVRRNACMALASLARNPDVRKVLRKSDKVIQILVSLLTNADQLLLPAEEFLVIQEYTTLCMAAMAPDFKIKVLLSKCGALRPLVCCLASCDPDIQRNAIETIALVLQDYEGRAELLQICDSLGAIGLLLKSEYPVIQYQALLALGFASEHAGVRAEMCGGGVMDTLLDYIGDEETAPLHVFAMVVISNCLDHPKSYRPIRERGGLGRLVALLVPPQGGAGSSALILEDSGTKKGPTKKEGKAPAGGPANTPRPGAKPAKEEEEELPVVLKDDINPFIPVMPDMLEHTCRAVARAAKNAQNSQTFHDENVEARLVGFLLYQDKPRLQAAAALALGTMTEFCVLSRETICAAEGLPVLVKLLASTNAEVQESAALAVANICTGGLDYIIELARLDAVSALTALVSPSGRENALVSTLTAIGTMTRDCIVREQFLTGGIVSALIAVLLACTCAASSLLLQFVARVFEVCRSSLVQSKVSLALASFSIDEDARKQVVDAEGVEPLVRLLCSPDPCVVRNASWALSLLANDEETAAAICAIRPVAVLCDIQQSPTRRNTFSTALLRKLMDCDLVEKYAHCGYLDEHNVIPDGFYDPGQLKASVALKTLEAYATKEIDNQRPIFFVAANKPSSQENLPEEKSAPRTPSAARVSSSHNAPDGKPPSKSLSVQAGGSLAARHSRTSVSSRDTRAKRSGSRSDKDEKRSSDVDAVDRRGSSEQPEGEGGAVPPAVFVPPSDVNLQTYIEYCHEHIAKLETMSEQIEMLARFVSEQMGGPLNDRLKEEWKDHMTQLKCQQQSNVIPIALVALGVQCHRALLFKVLADRIGLQCNLVRGDYDRAWNEVVLTPADIADITYTSCMDHVINVPHTPDCCMPIELVGSASCCRIERRAPAGLVAPPVPYIVNLTREPGPLLMRVDSCEAQAYRREEQSLYSDINDSFFN